MDMPQMMPGVPGGTVSLAAAGDWLLAGDDVAVEAGLRRVSSRGSFPSWVPAQPPAGLKMPKHAAGRGLVDLHGSFATMLEIDNLQIKRMRESLQAQDPELWEELAEDIGAEESGTLQQVKALASVLGVLAWSLERTDTGFGLVAAITTPERD